MATSDLTSDSTQKTPSVAKGAGFVASKVVHLQVEVDVAALTAAGATIAAGSIIKLFDLPAGTIILGISERRITGSVGHDLGTLSIGTLTTAAAYRAAAVINNTTDQDTVLHIRNTAAQSICLHKAVTGTWTDYHAEFHATVLLPGA